MRASVRLSKPTSGKRTKKVKKRKEMERERWWRFPEIVTLQMQFVQKFNKRKE